MPDPIKLTVPGSSVTFLCTACFQVPVGKYPEIEFGGMDGTTPLTIRVPKVSADRQLGRIPLTYEQCVGAYLTISRDPNKNDASKPFWGITLNGFDEDAGDTREAAGAAGVGQPQGAVTGKPAVQAPVAPPSPAKPESRDVTYLRITDWMLREVAPRYAKAGIPLSPEAAAAITATVWIDTRKHG